MNSCYLFLDDSILNCAILDVIEKRSNRMYQLIAFDINGTLLTSKKTIAKSSVEAIERAQDAGKQVVLSTGCSLSEVIPY